MKAKQFMLTVATTLALYASAQTLAQEFTNPSARRAKKNYEDDLEKARTRYATALKSTLGIAKLKGDRQEEDLIAATIEALGGGKANPTTTTDPTSKPGDFNTVRIPANKSPGWVVGEVNAGDSISIQYVSGMWSDSWFHPLLASPDEEEKAACLIMAKVGSDYGPLARIPTGTKDTPFVYTFQTPFESVILRSPFAVAAAGTTRGEAKGETTYKVKITKTK